MVKRKTKEQHDQEAYAALRLRVADIVSGAVASDADGEEWLSPTTLSAAIPSLQARLKWDRETLGYIWGPYSLDKFETVDTIAEHIFAKGIRA